MACGLVPSVYCTLNNLPFLTFFQKNQPPNVCVPVKIFLKKSYRVEDENYGNYLSSLRKVYLGYLWLNP